MTYKRRRTRASDSEDFLLVVLTAACVFWLNEQRLWFAIFCISGPITWWLLVQDTECGVWLDNKRRGCANKTRGRLGACHIALHRRRKHDEMRVALGLRPKGEARPAVRPPRNVRWPSPAASESTTMPERQSAAPTGDRVAVAAALVSIPASVATVVTTIVQIVGRS
jgi:hypothetical protein